MMTFMRIDLRALRGLISRPAPLILTCVCLTLVPAVVGDAVVSIIGRQRGARIGWLVLRS